MLLRVELDIIQHIFIRHDYTENVYWAEGFAFTSCIFSLSLCIFEAAGISTRGGNGNPESGHWHWRVDCCPFGGFCTYSPVEQNWWHSPPERSDTDLLPVWCRGLGDDLDEDVDLSRGRHWTTGRPDRPPRPALTGLQRWPGLLTTWPASHPIGRTLEPLAT